MRSGRVHELRASCDYALTLLELRTPSGFARAQQTLNRICALQDTDPGSKWYGLWSYYLEEPPEQMEEADWNWADFLGGTLVLVDIRHGERLEAGLRERVRRAIYHAALSIERRDVAPDYTNIAVKGTFVCAAAGARLGMTELTEYAAQRMARIAALVNASGSFAEYNSPVYARVTLTDLTRMRMYLPAGPVRDAGARLERRLWLHLARHWDGYRAQFAGPMSRCYETDLGEPFWLEKALGGRLGLADPAQRAQYGDLDSAIHDYRCPEPLAGAFLQPAAYLHRETFRLAPAPLRAIQGTTCVEPAFSLGAVNQGDFWTQSRPLLGFFGGRERPARVIRLRVIKDGNDFASALLWTVQAGGNVLGLVNFRSPGGDRHPSLDPVKNGEFRCGRLFLELSFEGLEEGFSFRQEGDSGHIAGNGIEARFDLCGGRFGTRTLHLEGTSTPRTATFTVDFKPLETPGPVRWADTREAWAVFTLALAAAPHSAGNQPCEVNATAGRIHAKWASPGGLLELTGLSRSATIEDHLKAFGERIDSQDVPAVRLEEQKA